MDRRERISNPEEEFRMAFDGGQSRMWTALPGIIESFDHVAMTCAIKPAISLQMRDGAGNVHPVELPTLLDCPVFFPSGGGCTLTFPIAPGDECLVVFASRCIDGWWQQGGIQAQTRLRMHNLSDGFCLPGVRSQPRRLSGVSTTAVQLRSDDGLAHIELAPATHAVNISTPGSITAAAPTITLTGAVTVNGTITSSGDITAGGVSLMHHTHSGVTPGGSNTGGPNP